jgi:UDP-N-acetylglucosamine:LPS N-acetylglucosamine transferase
MRVLILSCGTGGGHNAAASAMKEALEARGHSADVLKKKIRSIVMSVQDQMQCFYVTLLLPLVLIHMKAPCKICLVLTQQQMN